MRTPQKYLNNFKQGIITKEMLTFCLFSSNKRAKIVVTKSVSTKGL